MSGLFSMIVGRAKRSKYGAIRAKVDGITFASTREAHRYSELKLLERAGKIRGLRIQPMFPIVVNGEQVCIYRADFQYEEFVIRGFKWELVVEDVKGFKTEVYKLKKKLLLTTQGIEIKEVR